MSPLDLLLLDIAKIEAGRDALPSHSHLASLFELTLSRLRDEAEALRRAPLRRAA